MNSLQKYVINFIITDLIKSSGERDSFAAAMLATIEQLSDKYTPLAQDLGDHFLCAKNELFLPTITLAPSLATPIKFVIGIGFVLKHFLNSSHICNALQSVASILTNSSNLV